MISKNRYKLLLFAELFILLSDLLLNSFSESFRQDYSILLLLFIIQDSLQILAITLLLISLFQTNVFQAGFVELLFDRFRVTVFISLVYLFLTIIVQVYILTTRWSNPLKHHWASGLLFFYILQRSLIVRESSLRWRYVQKALTCSCIYYYFYKRAILRISDPRFYDDEWINHRVNHID